MPNITAPKTVRTLIAPDKFKGSLTAAQVADALASGLRSSTGSAAGGTVHCELLPLADGGDGSVDAAVASGFSRHACAVTGPRTASAVQARACSSIRSVSRSAFDPTVTVALGTSTATA